MKKIKIKQTNKQTYKQTNLETITYTKQSRTLRTAGNYVELLNREVVSECRTILADRFLVQVQTTESLNEVGIFSKIAQTTGHKSIALFENQISSSDLLYFVR